ncbi:hypothetical protein ACFFRR_011168 [Megaselia abdita]
MSCISSNFSSFFLDSLNDPSEFAKYLSNGDNRMVPIVSSTSYDDYTNNHHHPHHHHHHFLHHQNGSNGVCDSSEAAAVAGGGGGAASTPYNLPPTSYNHQSSATVTPTATASEKHPPPLLSSSSSAAVAGATTTTSSSSQNSQHFDGSFEFLKYLRYSADYGGGEDSVHSIQSNTTNSSLIDLDSTPSSSHKGAKNGRNGNGNGNSNNNFDLDSTYDHDSKHNIFDLHHQNNSCSSTNNSDSMMTDPTILAPHLSASNSNPSSECGSDNSNNLINNNNNVSAAAAAAAASAAAAINPKALMKFVIKENFDVHPSHKVEEGIFQHMNKLPIKKKDLLKTLGVTFTGHMSISDKSIIVENFNKFCDEYAITDHRPFLALNQCGMLKPEQIKFARYLGQGLPTFTLFCIYSNFKNLFCLKRFENYSKGSYDLQYILDKTKRFLSCTTADLKSITQQHHQTESNGVESTPPSTNSSNNNNQHPTPQNPTSGAIITTSTSSSHTSPASAASVLPPLTINSRPLDELRIFENYDVHETHRIEDGIFTHMARLSPKKQELLKQFGIQSNHNVTYYEKYVIIENFIKFCNEYKIMDHRPFLDFHDSGMPKSEQIKFARFLGQGLPNLTLYKIYLAFKDILALNRIEKITVDGYNLDVILKKKKKNLYNRMHAAVHRESTEASKQAHRESLAS